VRIIEITACPNCGSKNIGIGTLGDGLSVGISAWKEVCRDCGYQGRSLLFESEEDYNKFLKAMKEYKETPDNQFPKNEKSVENDKERYTLLGSIKKRFCKK